MIDQLIQRAYAADINKTLKDIIGVSARPECKDLNAIYCMVIEVINFLLNLGAILAFIMILWASVQYLTSYGDESKIESAKKTLIWTVAGIFLIAVCKGIVMILNNSFIAAVPKP